MRDRERDGESWGLPPGGVRPVVFPTPAEVARMLSEGARLLQDADRATAWDQHKRARDGSR